MFLKAFNENKKNYKTNLNGSYKYLPRTPVGSTAMNVNLWSCCFLDPPMFFFSLIEFQRTSQSL